MSGRGPFQIIYFQIVAVVQLAGITHPNLKLLKGAQAAHFELYLKDFFWDALWK